MDPRIRERRAAVQLETDRHRRRRLVSALVLLSIVASGWGLTRTALLDVDAVAVAGASNTTAATVREVSGISLGDRLTGVPLDRAAARVAALPWVQSVDVHRQWPGTVRISVVERTAVATMPAQVQGWLLVDATGRQLAHVPGPPPELVRIDAEPVGADPGGAVPAELDDLLSIAAGVPQVLRDRIVSLHPVDGGEVDARVRLRNNTEAIVRLGDVRQPSRTWLALGTVLDETDPRGLTQIDLRVPSAPVLTRG
jgi:cell division protein FtsQ